MDILIAFVAGMIVGGVVSLIGFTHGVKAKH